MASSEDNFNCYHGSSRNRGRSTAQMLFGEMIGTAAPSPSLKDDGPTSNKMAQTFASRNEMKRGLDIDLNVAPPDDDSSESPEVIYGENGEKILPTSAAFEILGFSDEHGLNCEGIAAVVEEINSGKNVSENEIEAHWSEEEGDGFDLVEKEAEEKETVVAEEEKGEKTERSNLWEALVDAAKIASNYYEEKTLTKKEREIPTRKRRTTVGKVEYGGELQQGSTGKKICREKRESRVVAYRGGDSEVAAPVVRSTRARTVAMPNKYKDSVLDLEPLAAPEMARPYKSGKTAGAVASRRKPR